jgi:hypothetical protein
VPCPYINQSDIKQGSLTAALSLSNIDILLKHQRTVVDEIGDGCVVGISIAGVKRVLEGQGVASAGADMNAIVAIGKNNTVGDGDVVTGSGQANAIAAGVLPVHHHCYPRQGDVTARHRQDTFIIVVLNHRVGDGNAGCGRDVQTLILVLIGGDVADGDRTIGIDNQP